MGYQNNKLGMLTGFGTTSSYHLDATDYDATGQDEGTTVGAYGDQLIQEYDYDQATSRLISGVTDLQTDASGAEDTTSYTHNQAGDVTSIQDAEDAGTTSATTDLQCFAYNDLHELTTAWTDNGTQDPAPTSPNPGGIGGCTNPHPGRLDHRRPGTVLEHFGEPALRSTARVDARYIGAIAGQRAPLPWAACRCLTWQVTRRAPTACRSHTGSRASKTGCRRPAVAQADGRQGRDPGTPCDPKGQIRRSTLALDRGNVTDPLPGRGLTAYA